MLDGTTMQNNKQFRLLNDVRVLLLIQCLLQIHHAIHEKQQQINTV